MSPTVPSSAAIGAALSFLFEHVPVLNTIFGLLSPLMKVIVIVVLCTLGGIVAFFAGNDPALATAAPLYSWLQLIQNIAAAIGASQVWHTQVNGPLSNTSDGN